MIVCNSELPLGANCSGEEMCLDEGSCCNPVLGECDCVDGTYDSNGGMPGGVCLYCKWTLLQQLTVLHHAVTTFSLVVLQTMNKTVVYIRLKKYVFSRINQKFDIC